jgi:hypothetical protein
MAFAEALGNMIAEKTCPAMIRIFIDQSTTLPGLSRA